MPGMTPWARPQALTTRVIRKSRCRAQGTAAKLWGMEKPALLTSTSTSRPARRHRVQHRRLRAEDRQVDADGEGVDAVGGAKLGGQRLQAIQAPGGQRQVEASRRIGPGKRRAQARRGAGDQGQFPRNRRHRHSGSGSNRRAA